MKLLCEDILKEYGFTEDQSKSNYLVKIFSRDNFEIAYKQGEYFYSNLGFDYPLRDLAALKKLYKENKRTDLTAIR